MKKEFLSLIGCGWLGSKLAIKLVELQYRVIVTTANVRPDFDAGSYFQFDLTQKQPIPEEIITSDVLLYLIPPLSLEYVKRFFDKIPEDKKIIFISSTSVYGKKMGCVDEETPITLDKTSSPLLVETESYLKSRFNNATILRFGGLYGDNRHPVYFLQGKKGLKNGGELLHLVHQSECIEAITKILAKNLWGETFNIVSDLRIKKYEYYTQVASERALELPNYEKTESDPLETNISNHKSKFKLDMNYNPRILYIF
ncbi:MAG: hypothetical protein K2Q18_18405 [Bdellovibrionales bacterium]|nr:hypothetical protein [Bdellovibrionales bacterium]